MKLIRNPELKGILVILLVALVLGVLLAGMSGKLEQWGLPWFTGAKAVDKIIFVSDRSGTNEIYIMNLDGSDQRQLTRDARVLSAPAISTSGNRIAFVGMYGSVSQVMAVGVGGGTPYALTSSTGSKRQPGYSPDGKKLSYIEAGRVFVAEINGTNPDPVLPTHEEMAMAMSNAEDRSSIPLYSAYSWAPDSESMAGVSSQDRMTDALAYLPKPEDKAQQLLPIPPVVGTKVTGLAFAAGKALLAASVAVGGQDVLIVFDPEAKQPRPVFGAGNIKLGAPAVSPDGSTIAVPMALTSGKSGAIMVKFDTQSGQSGLLARGKFENPVFSQDGETVLAVQRNAKTNKRAIVIIVPASGEVTQLTHEGDCFGAVFSPMSPR